MSRIVQRDLELDRGREVHALGQGVFGQRPYLGASPRASRRSRAIDEARERRFAIIETDKDRRDAVRRKCCVDEQIDAVAGRKHDPAVTRRKWLGGLAVDGYDSCDMPIDPHSEETIARSIEQPQPQPLIGVHRDIERGLPVGGEVRGPPCIDAAVCTKRPGIEDERDIAVDINALHLIDDQEPIKSAVLDEARRSVIPEGAGVGRGEAVVEAVSGRDRSLGQSRNAVHRVRDAHAVPMHGHVGDQLVLEPDAQLFAPLYSQRRPGDGSFKAADRGGAGICPPKIRGPGAGRDHAKGARLGGRRQGEQGGPDCGAGPPNDATP